MPQRILSGLRREAGATAPSECCGALCGVRRGTDVETRTLIPLTNEAHDHHREYLIDAQTVLRLERHAACAGLEVVGFYHSHVHSDAEPSVEDLELASPGYVYVIVDVPRSMVRAWRLEDDRSAFREVDVMPLAGAA
jgi:desampylase